MVGGVSSPALFATPSGAEPPFACGVIAQCSGRAIGRMSLWHRASSAAFGMAIEPSYTGAMCKTPAFFYIGTGAMCKPPVFYKCVDAAKDVG